LDEEEGPRVFDFMHAGNAEPHTVPDADITIPAVPESVPVQADSPIQVPAKKPANTLEQRAVMTNPLPTQPVEVSMCADMPSYEEHRSHKVRWSGLMQDGLFKVGESSFFFVDPTIGLPQDLLEELMLRTGVDDAAIVELHPGLLDQPIRWDVLAEIDMESRPMFANTLANWAFPDSKSPLLIHSSILENKKTVAFASLEDVWTDDPENSLLDLKPLRGKTLISLRASKEKLAPEISEIISVRETALSGKKRLFIVHIDSLDGPYALWIANLLRKVVQAYATSDWHRKKIVKPVAPDAP
jgi:hypothetical protein